LRKIRNPNRNDLVDVDVHLKQDAAEVAGPETKAKPSTSISGENNAAKAANEQRVSKPSTNSAKAGKKMKKTVSQKAEKPKPAVIAVNAEKVCSDRDLHKMRKNAVVATVQKSEDDPESYDSLRARANVMIRRHTLAAGGSGFIPLPAADVIGMTALQANLIEELSKLYGFTPTPGWSLRLAGLFAFSAGGAAIGSIFASSLAKLIPGVGTFLGAGSLAAYAAATTCALGRTIVHHYEGGGRPEHLVCSSFVHAVRDSVESGWNSWKQWAHSEKES